MYFQIRMRHLHIVVWMAAVVAASVSELPPKLPWLTAVPKDQDLFIGTKVTLTCMTDTKGELIYTFYKDDDFMQHGAHSTYEIDGDADDSGHYSCHTENDAGTSEDSDKYQVQFTEAPMPALTATPSEPGVFKDSEITLVCEVDPLKDRGLTYTFYKGDKPVQSGEGDYNMFTIDTATGEDAADYTCTIKKHGVESERSEMHSLNVMDKCNIPMDLLFLVDSSAIIADYENGDAKHSIQKVIGRFNVNPAVTRVALGLYAIEGHDAFCFNKYTTAEDIEEAVHDLECKGCTDGKNRTGAGLAYGRTKYFTTACGARPDVHKLVVVITGGRSTEDETYIGHQADLLREVADGVIAIGVGDDVDTEQLEMIASDENLAFTASDFNKLEGMAEEISEDVCVAASDLI